MTIPLYLKALAILFAAAIGIPLLLSPLRWAKVFQWKLPADTDLTNYFGRCLGAVVVAVAGMYWRGADDVRLHAFMLELLIGAFSLMSLVHVWGWLRKAQPWTETAEIPLYLALAGSAIYFRLLV